MASGAAGRRHRGKAARGLGAMDPRWDRNARAGSTLLDQFSDQFQITNQGVLELKASAVLGLLSASAPLSVVQGAFSLSVGDGLQVSRDTLQVTKALPVDDLAAGATTATVVTKVNELLANLRDANLLER